MPNKGDWVPSRGGCLKCGHGDFDWSKMTLLDHRYCAAPIQERILTLKTCKKCGTAQCTAEESHDYQPNQSAKPAESTEAQDNSSKLAAEIHC